MNLSHFSDRRLSLADIEAREPDPHNFKPTGFWVSVDGKDDWEEWSVAESFRLERLAIRHRVTLAADANILLMSTGWALEQFTMRYGIRDGYGRYTISWPTVASEYDGMIVAPYIWSCRLDGIASNWYYSWDCASGCIWKPRAIASIEVVTDLLREEAA